jgi:DNA replication initiation complex subunit (GINS family)
MMFFERKIDRRKLLEELPEELKDLLRRLEEMLDREEQAVRSLRRETIITNLAEMKLMNPKILFYAHGFGLAIIKDALYEIKSDVDSLDKAPPETKIMLMRICLGTLYDAYSFYKKIRNYHAELRKRFGSAYASKITQQLKTMLETTDIPRRIFCD